MPSPTETESCGKVICQNIGSCLFGVIWEILTCPCTCCFKCTKCCCQKCCKRCKDPPPPDQADTSKK